jgi:hypothetical protein
MKQAFLTVTFTVLKIFTFLYVAILRPDISVTNNELSSEMHLHYVKYLLLRLDKDIFSIDFKYFLESSTVVTRFIICNLIAHGT